jgi:bifunctional non-homologous end joining protein LigD
VVVDLDTLLAPEERALVRAAAHPRRLEPQLAQAGDGPPAGPGWLHERKLDGVRLHVHRDGGTLRLLTRLGHDRAGTFPELLPALHELGSNDLVADAEVVALEGDRDSFGRLQRRLGGPGRPTAAARDVPVHVYLFDLLHLDGHDLRRLPLVARKRLLRALRFVEPVRYTEHRDDDVAAHLAEACAQGWEGLLVKRADGPYRAGRSSAWRKLKCQRTGRFVVGGWTAPQGTRAGVGALLVGMDTPEGLVYAGRVGTGIDDATLVALADHLRRAEQSAAPFVAPPRERGLRWVVPHLVVEVRFSGWTESGRLRHPSLQRLRPDLPVTAATGEG